MKILLIISIVLTNLTFGLCQDSNLKLTSCNYAKEIVIDALGNITPITSKNYLLKDKENNYLSYYPAHEKKSFWYKIKVLSDCEITFDIFPTGNADRYNFFVYKNPESGNFCDNAIRDKIIPIRTNIMKDSMSQGTGLSQSVIVDVEDSKKLKDNMLYHTAYHQPIYALSGQEYYINVYHMSGDDCGHLFKLNVHNINNSTAGFRTVFQGCYKDEIRRVNPIIPETNPLAMREQFDNIKEKTFENRMLIRGMITDSLRKTGLKGQVKWIDKNKEEHVVITDDKGLYELYVDGQMFYELECVALGYRPKKLKFMKQTLYQEIKFLDFQMLSLQAGDNFVLNNIYFHPGTYAFKENSFEALSELAKFMNTNDLAQIEIQGHTNGKGVVKKNPRKAHLGPEWNFSGNEKKLSKLRAESVTAYLMDNGINQERLGSIGMGAKKMLYPEPRNKTQRDANKRVEISIISMNFRETSALLDE